MTLWWKLTVEWPCILGDWLWAYLAVPLLAQLERLTFKRVIYMAALTLLVVAFAQMVSIDLAFVWAGDAAFYFEVASAVILYAARGHARQALHVIGHKVRAAAQGVAAHLRRGGFERQRRNLNALRRKQEADSAERSDDEPAVWGLCTA